MSFVLEPRPYLDPQVQQLVETVQAEYVVRYGGPDESHVDPTEFDPPAGLLLLGLLDREPVATGAWRLLPDGTAEIKRMFVLASHRRRGLSRLVLSELERTAAAKGITRIVLGTGTEQPEAVALYASSGYSPVPGFGHYADAPQALFFGKTIAALVSGP